MTEKEFKETVKVGDQLQGYATGKIVTVTAIGKKRFLYLDHRGEGVSLIYNTQARWKKIEQEPEVGDERDTW